METTEMLIRKVADEVLEEQVRGYLPENQRPSKAVSIPVNEYLRIQQTQRWKDLNGDVIQVCEDLRAGLENKFLGA